MSLSLLSIGRWRYWWSGPSRRTRSFPDTGIASQLSHRAFHVASSVV